ncbi:pirin family protein [Pseudomonas sp. 22447]|nr:pirin family protein [Pseudomonas viciae]
MIVINKSEDRGSFKNSWLDAKFSFEFGSYRKPERRGFSDLIVFNDDIVQPKSGFTEHSHSNVEVMSYPLMGEIEHRDSIGNCQRVSYGDVHLMRAGKGISHSEMNPSDSEIEHHVQWWIKPKNLDSDPSYQLCTFTPEDKVGRLCLIASDNSADGVLCVDQDVRIYASILTPIELVWKVPMNRRAYLHVLSGGVAINDFALSAGDAIFVGNCTTIAISSLDSAEVLLFDLR